MTLAINPAAFSALIQRLYASDGAPWPSSAFLRQCCDHLRASTAAILVLDRLSGQSRYLDFQRMSPEVITEFIATYAGKDPVERGLMHRAPRRAYLRRELVSDEVVATDPFFTEWFVRLGYDDMCCARIPLGPQYDCDIGFTRNVGDAPFGREELEFFDLLLPHIEQSLKLNAQIDRLTVLSDLAQENVAQIGAGLLILNEDGRVNFMNRIAQDLLRNSSALRESEGVISLRDREAQARFASLVTQCISISAHQGVMTGGVVSAPRPGAAAIGIMVMPYRNPDTPSGFVAKTSRATVLMFDPDKPRLTPPLILRDLYNLSEPEVQVCWRLANGDSLEEIATALEVGKETVRSQLKRIFVKTGTSRQPELVRLVLLGPALWAVAQPAALP